MQPLVEMFHIIVSPLPPPPHCHLMFIDAQLENPQRLHVITARDRGCPGVATTSETAHKLACQVAVNAGFFNMQSGDCIGNVVSRGHYAQISGLRNVNFGITLDGNFIVGYLTKQTVCSLPFTELVAGVIWLVREGRPFWEESAIIEGPDFMDILAPRTVLGHDRFGRALLLVVEGTETVDENDQRTASGVTISELGQLASSLGMYNAINLDGGGSSAFVIDGRLVNRITESCPDDPLRICERPITTIICIK